jgi:hypothetical protein
MADNIDIRDLVEQGYDEDEIKEVMLDAGYDIDDIAEAWVDAGFDFEYALRDALETVGATGQELTGAEAYYYADLLDLDVGEVYDIYYGYGEDVG